MASPIVRDTIKKLKARRAALQKQVKGPLEELRQIEQDLEALEAAIGSRPAGRRAPRGANQSAILRAVRNGATTAEEVAGRTGLAAAAVKRSVKAYTDKDKLLVVGPNGLTLTKAGRDRLATLERAPSA